VATSHPRLWGPMRLRTPTRYRLILADVKYAPGRLDFGPGAPASNKCARKRGIREIDRNGVVQHTAHSGGCHRPADGAAVLIEPGVISVCRLPKPPGGTPILIRTGKRRSAIVTISRGLPGTSMFLVCSEDESMIAGPLSTLSFEKSRERGG
jgi:hypothetical protein